LLAGNAGEQPVEGACGNCHVYASVRSNSSGNSVLVCYLLKTLSYIEVKLMAGSKKYFVYTTDNGTDFALLADESNTEAVNAGTQDFADGVAIIYELPKNLRPRRLIYANALRTRKITCYALTETIFDGAPVAVPTIADPIDAGTLTLVDTIPESRKRIPIALDTGLTDGDAT